MEIKHEYPPNFSDIIKVFPKVENTSGVLFCWGQVIYNPSGFDIPVHLLHHEAVHSDRQRSYGVEEWWVDYLHHPEFRLAEELPAHIEEYKYAVLNHPTGALRKTRVRILNGIAERLSGPLYNNLLRFDEAKYLIKHEVRHDTQPREIKHTLKSSKYDPRTEDKKHLDAKGTELNTKEE